VPSVGSSLTFIKGGDEFAGIVIFCPEIVSELCDKEPGVEDRFFLLCLLTLTSAINILARRPLMSTTHQLSFSSSISVILSFGCNSYNVAITRRVLVGKTHTHASTGGGHGAKTRGNVPEKQILVVISFAKPQN